MKKLLPLWQTEQRLNYAEVVVEVPDGTTNQELEELAEQLYMEEFSDLDELDNVECRKRYRDHDRTDIEDPETATTTDATKISAVYSAEDGYWHITWPAAEEVQQ